MRGNVRVRLYAAEHTNSRQGTYGAADWLATTARAGENKEKRRMCQQEQEKQ
jgi:hypothetical protein